MKTLEHVRFLVHYCSGQTEEYTWDEIKWLGLDSRIRLKDRLKPGKIVEIWEG